MNTEERVAILILDDDEGMLHLTRRTLERKGYQVTTAVSVQQAIQHVEESCPDLLIVDYDLKTEQTGLDFFRIIQHPCRDVPIIIVTTFNDESRIIEALRAGVTDVLPKSSNYLEYLPEAVERVLNQVRMRKRLIEAEKLRDRERYYRKLAEAIPQLVWTSLPDGRCDFLSKQWLDYTGLEEEQQRGLKWLETVIHPDDRQRVYEAWTAAIKGVAAYDLEFRIRRHDGVYRWFQTRGAPVYGYGTKNITKWFGTCTDIEDRKCTEEERELLLASERTARAEAERAVQIKDEFVATLSHELRTPLNAIIGWAQFLLRDRTDAEKLKKGLEIINRNAKLQTQMVDDLLDMSRIMSGKLRLTIQAMNLADIIEDVMVSVQPAAEAKEIKLVKLIEPVGFTQGDPARLQQVLWNLIMNAIKFTQKRGQVEVTLKSLAGEMEIVVSDNGLGIKPDFLPHVFDRFRQQDGSITRQFSGLGLGLSISKQLVELHGGSIKVVSAGENKGAAFFVYLPLNVISIEKPLDDSLNNECQLPGYGQEPNLDGIHVLLLEDQPDARELIQRILEEQGATVAVASNVPEAFTAYQQQKPQVIVSDIGLPGQDGYTFMRRLRKMEGQNGVLTPAAALTALAHKEDRRRALLAGFQTHIAKPVDPMEVLVVVASLAGRTSGKHNDETG